MLNKKMLEDILAKSYRIFFKMMGFFFLSFPLSLKQFTNRFVKQDDNFKAQCNIYFTHFAF